MVGGPIGAATPAAGAPATTLTAVEIFRPGRFLASGATGGGAPISRLAASRIPLICACSLAPAAARASPVRGSGGSGAGAGAGAGRGLIGGGGGGCATRRRLGPRLTGGSGGSSGTRPRPGPESSCGTAGSVFFFFLQSSRIATATHVASAAECSGARESVWAEASRGLRQHY